MRIRLIVIPEQGLPLQLSRYQDVPWKILQVRSSAMPVVPAARLETPRRRMFFFKLGNVAAFFGREETIRLTTLFPNQVLKSHHNLICLHM